MHYCYQAEEASDLHEVFDEYMVKLKKKEEKRKKKVWKGQINSRTLDFCSMHELRFLVYQIMVRYRLCDMCL